jgi:hypothetical protein
MRATWRPKAIAMVTLQDRLDERAHLAADRIFQRIEPVGADIAQWQRRSGRRSLIHGVGLPRHDLAAAEVAVLMEVVLDRGVNGGKFLQGPDVPEFRHGPLSSSKRLM